MTTDNQYYKQIAEKLTGETISGVHTNNYYLNKICTSLGYTYSGVTCNGIYIKDFARHFTEQTYTKIHFNNYFLKKLAEHLTGETYGNHDDNYFLGLINENIIPQPPSFTSVEVTSDKSILSYTDSESATLTAQLMNGDSSASISGVTVQFYKYVDGTNDVLLGSDVTDSNGEALYTYASAGIGDIQVYAKVRTLVSKTYGIADRTFYDKASSEHLSKYNASGLSFTYDSSNTAYYISKSSNNNFAFVTLSNINFGQDILIKADVKLDNGSGNFNTQFAFKFGNVLTRLINAVISNPTKQITISNSSYADITNENVDMSANTWYNLELQIMNGSATLTLKNGETIIGEITGDVSSLIGSSNSFQIAMGYSGSYQKGYIKNIEIQEL